MDEEERNRIAAFRFGVISDLLDAAIDGKERAKRIREKATRVWQVPGSDRSRLAERTIRDWLIWHRRRGWEGLKPSSRDDQGKPRALRAEIADLVIKLVEENPKRSVPTIIRELELAKKLDSGERISESSVYRLLASRGLARTQRRKFPPEDRRRFAYEHPGELWHSDILHGPKAKIGGRTRKSYLAAVIDDATRVIPHAAFIAGESLEAFLPVLKTAVLKRGLPKRLFVDCGSLYRAEQLDVITARVGIALIHARAYSPASKGKIERWFRTMREQFLIHISDGALTIEELNSRLWAWIEGEYHHAPHRSLSGKAPLDAWMESAEHVRFPENASAIEEAFLFSVKRRVTADRVVSLDGVAYEVGAEFVKRTIELRYDPGRSVRVVRVYFEGEYRGDARPVDALANARATRDRAIKEMTFDERKPSTGINYAELIEKTYYEEEEEEE